MGGFLVGMGQVRVEGEEGTLNPSTLVPASGKATTADVFFLAPKKDNGAQAFACAIRWDPCFLCNLVAPRRCILLRRPGICLMRGNACCTCYLPVGTCTYRYSCIVGWMNRGEPWVPWLGRRTGCQDGRGHVCTYSVHTRMPPTDGEPRMIPYSMGCNRKHCSAPPCLPTFHHPVGSRSWTLSVYTHTLYCMPYTP